MKSLKEQIKFIDTKLLKLYGFKGITDYSYSICTSEPESVPIDLIKLNELIGEFRKIFHSKNFSLHKTEYKILTKSQAVCLLKTCLEVTSVPFDLSLKSKKKYLRLISKNNILDDYINTLKMAENGSFQEKSKINVSEWKNSTVYPDKHYILNQEIPTKSNNLTNENTEKIHNEIRSEPPNLSRYVEPFGLKEYKSPETITKTQLLSNIKKTTNFEYTILPAKLLVADSIDSTSIYIPLKQNELVDKNIKSFCVEICSKKFNNEPIISEAFINELVKNLEYEIVGVGNEITLCSKFVSGANNLVSDIIILNCCLKYHDIKLKLVGIEHIIQIIDTLEFKISGEYVSFYTELESKLSNCFIEQEIWINSQYNILRIAAGMCGMAFTPYLTLEQYTQYKNTPKDKFCRFVQPNIIGLNKEDIGKEKDFKGKVVKLKEFEGFELESQIKSNLEKNMDILKEKITIGYDFDFFSWNISHNIISRALEYSRTTKSNKYIHTYQINLRGNFDTIGELAFEISELLTNKLNIIDIYYTRLDHLNSNNKLDWSISDNRVKINIKSCSHINVLGIVKGLTISIESDSESEPIKSNIIVCAKVFRWKSKFFKNFSNLNGFLIGGTGFFNGNSNSETIIIYEDKEPEDYKIIEEWINKI